MSQFVELDGSDGEGGGQILRSGLALSVLTGRTVRVINIRAGRAKPGLAAQHLACVRAAAAICGGTYKGGSIGSTVVTLEPGDVKAGSYSFSVGTAGATGLVLQTVYLPLILRGKAASRVTITGGTHVPHSPCFHYLATTFVAHLRNAGLNLTVTMTRPGFYPRGGGEIVADLEPAAAATAISLTECPPITTAGGFSAVAGEVAESVAARQARRLGERLKRAGVESHLPTEHWRDGAGSVAAVTFRQPPVPATFVALGERGKPAEKVADEVADEALKFRDAGAPLDAHAADQLLLPLAFAEGRSIFRTSEVTSHLLTNAAVVMRFVDREITVEGNPGEPGTVRVV